jgi:hypothetical protein
MKYAYISTQEPYSNGVRIVQVQNTKEGLIDVDGVLFWVECSANTTPENSYYDVNDNQIKLITD